MPKRKFISVLCIFIAAFCLLAACNRGGNSGNLEMSDPVDTSGTDSAASTVGGSLDLSDLSSDVNAQGTTTVENGEYTFTESGNYILSGDYGALTIGADKLQLHLFLSGANFKSLTYGTSDEGNDYKKTQLTLTLVEGTTNTATCSKGNAIHVKGSMDINGKGKLTVNCTGKNAVKVSKALRIVDAELDLSAANHAVSALSISAANCTINVLEAGKDGLNAECDDETTAFTADEGFVALSNVTYTCNTKGDGIQADTVVYINGGAYNITTEGEFVANTADNRAEYNLTADDFRYIKSGDSYQKVANDYMGGGTKYALAQGCKGIKVGEIEYPDSADETGEKEITVTDGNYCIVIETGQFVIDSTDDAVHANSGDLIVKGGEMTIATFDDGLTADGLTKITGGKVTVTSSYEGLEGGDVEVSGGTLNITATDDGINAASDDHAGYEHIMISGGEITVNAQGDGIDSNGSVEITGGKTVVFGPTGNGDGGLDSETGIYVNGGVLLVLASRGMTELPVTDSTQFVLAYGQTSNIAAGKVVSVRDSKGNKLIEVTAVKPLQTLIFSSAELASGSTYSVYVDDSKLADIKLTSRVTSSGVDGGFDGNPGGWQPGGQGPGGNRPGGGGIPPR